MTILAWLAGLLLAAALAVVVLAQVWSRTPHGRLKPIFALVFGVTNRLDPKRAEQGLGAGAMHTPEDVARIRAEFLTTTAPLAKPVPFDGTIEDRKLPGSPGGELPVRVYRPAAAERGPLPLIVYFHGGGFVIGSPDYTDVATRILALETPAVVVSVDYRMAPEHPFPAPVEDCEYAVAWCHQHAESLGARPGPVAVAGDSAGGNLSAVVALRDQRAGHGRVGFQALIYPAVDATRVDRESQTAFASGYGLSRKDMIECMDQYVPPGVDRADPDVSPLFGKDKAGAAPAFVVTAGFDVLRDEGIEYAASLRDAGVPVIHVNEDALPHGFITMTRLCSEARATLVTIAHHVRGALAA